MPTEEEKYNDIPMARRRWKRRLFWCFLLLLGFLIWANGPGIRWGLKKVILQQLAAQELLGSFEVEGTALSGIAIRDISLKGTSTVQSVKSDLIEVKWSLGSLIRKELASAELRKLHLVIDPKAPKPAATGDTDSDVPNDPPAEGSLTKTLDLVRGFIQPAKISLTDINIEVLGVTKVTLSSFTHTAAETEYLITDLKSADHLDRPLHNPRSVLTWNDNGFTIDQIIFNPQLSILNFVFEPEESASLVLSIDESKLVIESDLHAAHRVSLESGPLVIPTLIDLVKPGLEAAGKITKLQINTGTGRIDFEARDLEFQEQEIALASIEAFTEDLFSPFDQAIDLKVALDKQLKVEGSVVLDRSIIDSVADLNLVVNWPRVPTVEAKLAYDSREARVIANTLDDLRATARFQVDEQSYHAEILSQIKDASVLEDRLAGPLKFTATAKGNLKTSEHSGTLNLESLEFRQPDFPEAVSQGTIVWNWPESVTIESLEMTTPDATAKAKLGWTDDTLSINHIKLFEGTDELLLVQARLPAPLKTRSLDELLESPEPLSLDISSKPLTFNRLSSFIPIPDTLSGILQTQELNLSGTFEEPALNGRISLKEFASATTPDLLPADITLTFETSEKELVLKIDANDAKGELLKLDGGFPFLPRQWIDHQKTPLDTAVSLAVSNDSLDLRRIQPFVPSIPGIKGTLGIDLKLSGTLETPLLGGEVKLQGFNTTLQEGLPDLGLQIELATENETLTLSGSGREAGIKFMTLAGALPLETQTWLGRAPASSERPMSFEVTNTSINLARVHPFVSKIKMIEGKLNFNASVKGTLSDPEFSGDANLSLRKMRLSGFPISDFKDTEISATFEEEIVTITKGGIVASGGKANLTGTIDLTKKDPELDPVFDLALAGKYILLYRNQDFTFRGHPNLRVEGPLSKANISGTLEIADSLIYKDVEILPLGVPRTTDIPRSNLPSFSQRPNPGKKKVAPETGIMTWGLEIDVSIKDPILIRGNLVEGEITGQNLKVRGTIGDPKTSGSLFTKDLVADLPFSKMEVETGVVTLRPDSLTNPYLNIRGISEVGSYLVQVYVSGEVQNPNLVLTSDPPLPESEIMLLLATGSSSAQLTDQQVASQKALQYLFETLRRRNGGRDKSVFQRLFKNSDQIELSLGETNQYSGRNFSSATLELSDRWDFTTQIDEQGQNRALVVFSIRFK